MDERIINPIKLDGGGSVIDSSGSQIAEGTRGFAGDVDAFQVEHYEHFGINFVSSICI